MNKDECKDLLDELDYYAISDANPHPVLPHQDLIDLCAQAAAKIRALAAMQAGEPVAYWIDEPNGRGQHLTFSKMEAYGISGLLNGYANAKPLFTRPPSTSEAEAMLAYAAKHGWPIRWAAPSGNGEDWGYIGGTGYFSPLEAIRAAMNSSNKVLQVAPHATSVVK